MRAFRADSEELSRLHLLEGATDHALNYDHRSLETAEQVTDQHFNRSCQCRR